MLIIEALKWMALSWVIVSWISFLFEKFIEPKYFFLLCLKCITFWTTLIFTQDPFIAAIASLIAYLFDSHLEI